MSTETVTYEAKTYYEEAEILHTWTVTDDRGMAAELFVSIQTGEIANIFVRSDRRREGLARDLYAAAIELGDVFHAPQSHRTPEGDAFAQAVGGESLECTLGCCGTDEEEEDY